MGKLFKKVHFSLIEVQDQCNMVPNYSAGNAHVFGVNKYQRAEK
jgi:hypothetical protein